MHCNTYTPCKDDFFKANLKKIKGEDSQVAISIKTPDSINQPKTNGIVGTLRTAFWPLTQILLQLIQSYMENMYGETFPCNLKSITPWVIECTQLKNL